ncbi:MAG: hypothetical protein JNJ77_03680 [Planctomycetia bacterium]|nr:hypothetical protein [Planctomycetia bacterium]
MKDEIPFLNQMPFRPYKRFVSTSISPADYYTYVQLSAITAGAEEEELLAIGGRLAVLQSIRRHISAFDPSDATYAYAPAWVKLKPYLVQAGLNPVNEHTTLSDIKSFLDAYDPSNVTSRLSTLTPASNYQVLANMIGDSEITSVFDPYLENSSLCTLSTILSFGRGGIAKGIRLLGSADKANGPIPRLTKLGLDAWLKECKGELRVLPTGSKEHRRFLLLSDGKSLIIGHSLNAFHKNEAVRVEDGSSDTTFFEEMWSRATPLL